LINLFFTKEDIMKIPIEITTKKYNREIENIEVIGTIPFKASMKISSEIKAMI